MKLHPFRNPKNPLSTHLFFILLGLLLIGLSLVTRTVFAYHQDLTVNFDELEVRKVHGQVVVEYEVDPESWSMLHRVSITPRLNLYLPLRRGHHVTWNFQRAYSLHHRRGVLTFPRGVKLRGARRAELRLVGSHGYYRIDRMSLGRTCAERLRLAVVETHSHGPGCGHPGYDEPDYDDHDDHYDDHHEPPRHHPRDEYAEGRWTAKVIEACGQHEQHMDVGKCLEAAQEFELRLSAARTIRACGQHSNWSADFEDCLEGAAKLRHTPAATVDACGESTNWSKDFKKCIRTAADIRIGAPATIRACADATNWSSDFAACLDSARKYSYNAAPVIDACGETTDWSSDLRQCVDAGAGRSYASR